MAFVEQEDILNVFEGLTRHLLKEIKGVEVDNSSHDLSTCNKYGNDKPDIRFGMEWRIKRSGTKRSSHSIPLN
jgi:aspartyl-tRNA synthetase